MANKQTKQKVLTLCSRGVNYQDRHLMVDLRKLISNSKKDCKFDKKDSLTALNEIASLSSCNKCVYLENRKGKILYMWIANINGGPSVKFHVTNVHTMADIKLIGNCLQKSKAILSFDSNFDKQPHLKIIKRLLTQVFNSPVQHPKPYVDHVITFSVLDGRIWFRNYEILKDLTMAEIGPRMVLMPMLILASSFTGKILWANYKRSLDSKYVSKTKNNDNEPIDADTDESDETSNSDDDGEAEFIDKYLK